MTTELNLKLEKTEDKEIITEKEGKQNKQRIYTYLFKDENVSLRINTPKEQDWVISEEYQFKISNPQTRITEGE